MFPIEQSAFLHALGHAIGNSLWQVAAIWLLYAAITGLLKLSASRKYQLATAASMAGFVWFAITFFYNFLNAPLPGNYTHVYAFSDASENANRSSFVNKALFLYHSFLSTLKSLSPYISCAYLLVFLLLGVRLVNGFRQVKFFATQGLGKVDVKWRLFVKRNAEILQIKQTVQVFTSHYVQSPLTMGFWKPIILLPVASLNNLDTQQVEAILLHELAHIRRHDYLINIFVQIAEICLFFNPFMRFLLKQIRQERENSCDDYVLQFQYNAKDYAKALLTIEKNNAATLLALSANDNESFQLLNRVKRMVAPQPHAFNYRQQLYLLLLLTILGLGFTVIVPKPKINLPFATNEWGEKTNKLTNIVIGNKTNSPSTTNPPAAFDLVKTIQGIQEYAESLNLEAIEEEGRKMGEQAEAIGNAYGEQMEKQMQPYIADINKWAENFLENNAGLENLTENDFKDVEFKDKAVKLGDLNKHMAPALQKLQDAMKTFPKLNINFQQIKVPVAPVAALPSLPCIDPNQGILSSNCLTFDRARMAKEKLQQATELEKSKLEMKRGVANARMQYIEQMEAEVKALQHQHSAFTYSKKIISRVTAGANKAICNTIATNDDEEENDETEVENITPKAEAKAGKNFSYTLKIPDVTSFKNFGENFYFEWNNRVVVKEKRKKDGNSEHRVIVRNGNQETITNTSGEDLDILDFDTDDIKTIDIHQQKRLKNGKEQNVVIIRIIPSR